MSTQSVSVPGPIAVVPSPKAVEQLARRPDQLFAEITHLSVTGVLPARMEPNERRLILYTRRYVAFLYLTGKADAYRLGHVSRRSFRDEDRLLAGALLLHCPGGWHAYQDVRDLAQQGTGVLSRPRSAYWSELCYAWAALGVAGPPSPALPMHRTAFLDLLTGVVEASRDIEIAKQDTARPLSYRRRGGTREERHSARGVYAFDLARPTELAAGAVVYIGEQPDLRGRVVRAAGRELVVRFEAAVDYQRIPAHGTLRVLPSDRVYRAQLAAIDTLRSGEAANPGVLATLVDGRFQPYRPDPTGQPRRRLHPRQRDAFERALSVPDLLLVLGPPGTGKTTTITEIAVACVARGQRVLIASHTNRAVDNVLENLPPDVRTVRVGNEDSMTTTARGLMVETHVETIRQEILTVTAASSAQLADFDGHREVIDRWLANLADRLADARAAEAQADKAETTIGVATRAIQLPIQAQLETAEFEVARWRSAVENTQRDLATARRRFADAQGRAGSGVLAFVHRWRASRAGRRVESLRAALPAAQAALSAADSQLADLRSQAATLAAADPEVAALTAERDRARTARDDALGDAGRAGEVIRGILRPLIAVPTENPTNLVGWDQFHQWADTAVATIRRRAALLAEWRTRVADADVPLQRELVRYADVVAATCIGTATSALLAGLEFDLAIIDEAGQISMPNLLVPLVRAHRGVLVGDHRQLPPFLDDDVRRWADGLANTDDVPPQTVRQVGELLRDSGFERLYPAAGPNNGVMLTLQRRMPRVLGDFVSDAFYDGVLRTEHPGVGSDPIFGSPFAMVDTVDRPPAERFEQDVRGSEAWRQRGYRNPSEADLIAALVSRYAGWYQTWAVIVPYRAQTELVIDRLTAVLGDVSQVADNVGTVDSFQGGERDLIVYGFTRSNDRGDIGFLAELRRLNVAITRAKQQLVLVGDSSTLRAARHPGFAALTRSMTAYLARHGDVQHSQDVLAMLNRPAGQRP